MGGLAGKKKKQREVEEKPVEQPDYETLERSREVRRRQRRQNNTVLGGGSGSLG
jgi:hypothetical protein